jgi:hypothetical protein
MWLRLVRMNAKYFCYQGCEKSPRH